MAKKPVEIKYNPNWIVSFEYKHNKDILVKGTEIKFKYQRGIYRFEKHVINTKTNSEWIDCIGFDGYRSFSVDDLKGIIKPRKKRIKKNV